MKYKMVVLDIDGTLLDSQQQLRPAVIDVVRKTIGRGVLVTLATGRPFDFASKLASQMGIDIPLILEHGSIIQDSCTAAVLYEDALPNHLLCGLVHEVVSEGYQPFLCRSPLGNDEILSGPSAYDNPAYPSNEQHLSIHRVSYEDLCDVSHVTGVFVFHRQDVLSSLYTRLLSKSTYKLRHRQVKANPQNIFILEILNGGCSKAQALTYLARTYKVSMNEVLAIGDDHNDLELFDTVGMSVAMGNAIPAILDRAKAIVGTNDEDGVVEALNRFVLPI